MLPKINLTPKTKKILNIVVDVVVAVVLVFALFMAVCTISSKAKGYDQYTEVFGKAYLAVRSDSMDGDKKDNFKYGDLIAIKLVSNDEAKNLKEDQIISFKDPMIVNDKWVINSHRIKEVVKNADGSVKHYVTHGDNNPASQTEIVLPKEVIGVYQGKAGGIGRVFLFMSSSAGFFVCIVLPSLLVVAYFAVNLILVIRKEKKVQTAEAEQAQLEERERLRQELLAEMQGQNTQPAAVQSAEEKPVAEDKAVADEKTEDKPAEQKKETSSDIEEDKK